MKKLLKFLLLGLTILFCQQAFACECNIPPYSNWIPYVQRNLTQSEHVFIGEVISFHKDATSVKIVDVFKGHLKPETLVWIDSEVYCSNLPSEGYAVFYAANKNDSLLHLGPCTISRSISRFTSHVMPPPPRPNFKGDEDDYYKEASEKLEGELQLLLLKNWINEYALLNAYRNNYRKPIESTTNNKDYISYLALALSIVAVFIALFKKRP